MKMMHFERKAAACEFAMERDGMKGGTRFHGYSSLQLGWITNNGDANHGMCYPLKKGSQ